MISFDSDDEGSIPFILYKKYEEDFYCGVYYSGTYMISGWEEIDVY